MSNFDGNALAKDAYGRPPDLLEKNCYQNWKICQFSKSQKYMTEENEMQQQKKKEKRKKRENDVGKTTFIQGI